MTEMIRSKQIGKLGVPYDVRRIGGVITSVFALSQDWSEEKTFDVVAPFLSVLKAHDPRSPVYIGMGHFEGSTES